MNPIPNLPRSENKRIVVAGAGFGGLRLVRSLENKGFQVVLIDRNNYHQFQPLYYQVATSGLEPSSIAFPLRKLFQGKSDFHFRMANLERIDAEKRILYTDLGILDYDILVLAMGASTNFFGKKDLEENSLPMKSIPEAIRMRNILLENYEKALNLTDPDQQEQVMNIVVVGGGPTGVELAGSIADMKSFVFPADYPELDFDRMNIFLIEATAKVLAPMSEASSREAAGYLKRMGVTVRTEAAVESYDGVSIRLSTGEEIRSSTVLWAAGIQVPFLPGLEKALRGRGGRLVVGRTSRLEGLENIYVIGDQALMAEEAFPNGHPQVAQPAIQQARLLAKNLIRQRKKLDPLPFYYKDKGSMATIGRNKAVVDLGKVHFRGFFAWIVWILVHLVAIVGTKNRFFILINWAWNYMTYDQSLRLIIRPNKHP
ncbi:MAG: NADH dehydrogenase [Bacteroidetes bacterium GWF2_49_14]|nr:MAG: NADH dehydrogenase [Bacteroidetes bacterium GWF2_49_14]HBB92545.1 FAD-dependent oxidoreductase [Bacteroidales bacterium]